MAKLINVFQVIRSTTADFTADFLTEDDAIAFILSQDNANLFRIIECKKVVAEVAVSFDGDCDDEMISVAEKAVSGKVFSSLCDAKIAVCHAFCDAGVRVYRIENVCFCWK
jgi:hypothetical protein